MSYRKFTLSEVESKLQVKLAAAESLFAEVREAAVSEWLETALRAGRPLAEANNNRKARAAWLIAPTLLALVQQTGGRIGLFPGLEFDVDKELGLVGVCDYIISASPGRWLIDAPFLAVTQGDPGALEAALPACLAQMAAARLHNEREGGGVSTIYGALTDGLTWRFLKLDGAAAQLERREYSLDQPGLLLGVLLRMCSEAALERETALSRGKAAAEAPASVGRKNTVPRERPLFLITCVCDEGVYDSSFRVVEADSRLAVAEAMVRRPYDWDDFLRSAYLWEEVRDGEWSAEELLERIDDTSVDGDSRSQLAIHEIEAVEKL